MLARERGGSEWAAAARLGWDLAGCHLAACQEPSGQVAQLSWVGYRLDGTLAGQFAAHTRCSPASAQGGRAACPRARSHLCPGLLSVSTAERFSMMLATVLIEIKNIIHESPSARVGLSKCSELPPPPF